MDSLDLSLDEGAAVSRAREVVVETFPSLTPLLAAARVAVNEEYCVSDRCLRDGDTIAFIPPVSGG